METDERNRREDRAVVSAFYAGQPPLSQAQANEIGLKVNVNNLFGYTDLAASKEAALALYTKPARLWNVTLKNAPIADKSRWEAGLTAEFNAIVKKYGRLRLPYEGVAGDATLHGEGEFFFPDPLCPIPRHLPLSKRLIPNHALASAGELTYFDIQTGLKLETICWHLSRKSKGWNLKALSKIKEQQLENLDRSKWSGRSYGAIDSLNPEEIEYARQAQGDIDRAFRTEIPVDYFFQTHPDRDGSALDLTIIQRAGERQTKEGEEESLFDQEEYFPAIEEAIHPFFMDCILGGEPKWHRVKGQGHLNYYLAWHTELLMCKLLQGVSEASQTWWTSDSSATREDLERIILKNNGIIPEGISLLPNRPTMNFEGAMQVLSIIQQRAARNSRSAFGNNEGDGQGRELQVQAMFRQNAITAQQSSRLSNWYDSKSRLGNTILGRYTCPYLHSTDRWYSEKMEFQAGLKRRGIPLYYVQPFNVQVTATKIIGDGDDMQAKAAAGFLMANIAMYPPETQRHIKRDVTGVMIGDYEKAEFYVPSNEEPPADQVRLADGENNTCIVQGRSPKIDAKDVDEVHLQAAHLPGLSAIIQKAAQRGEEAFTPDELAGFTALGAHCHLHITRMQGMGKKDQARKYMEALMQVAAMGDKLKHNLQQQQQKQQQEPVSPVDAAKLQLQQQALQLKAEKDAFAKEKFSITQASKEQQAAHNQSLAIHKDGREESKHRVDTAEKDARLALDIHSTAHQMAQPPAE